jgi:hypothetical protein
MEGSMPRGLLGTRATLVADINLILQVVIVVALAVHFVRFRQAGRSGGAMLLQLAVLVNAVLIVAIMNPSFFRIFPFALRSPTAPVPILLWPHMALGAAAELLGVYLVFAGTDGSRSSGRLRALSWLLLALWVVAWLVGLVVYSRLYIRPLAPGP